VRAALVVALVCLASVADAKPRTFHELKLSSQNPPLHKNSVFHARLQPLREAIVACGPALEGPRWEYPSIRIDIAANGKVTRVAITTKNLSDETIACVRQVIETVSFPARKQASVLDAALIYR